MQQSQSSRYSTQSRNTFLSLIYFVFACFSLVFMQHSVAEVPLAIETSHPDNRCTTKIISTQVAKATDDLNHAPKTGWENVELPHNWDLHWHPYTGSAWYKIIWSYHCTSSAENHPFALSIDRINLAGIVYSNNELIWRDKSLVEPLSRSWNMPRYWILSSSSIKDGPNEILVRVVGVQSQNSGLGTIKIGEVDQITQLTAHMIFERRTLYFFNLIITIIMGTTGLLIWCLRRQETAFGWFALNCLFWVLFASNIIITEPIPFLTSLLNARLNMIFLVLYILTSCLFVWRFCNVQYPTLEKSLSLFSSIMILLLVFCPEDYLRALLIWTFLFCCVLFIFNCVFIQWIAFSKRKLDIYLLALVFFSFVVIIAHDLIFISTRNPNFLMWTPFGAPITSLVISFILGWRISRNMRHIEKFNQMLESTVEKVTFDLEQSLDKKHQLELDNTRLQERLALSHDLHDGLGGSIVRSMILLEHSEHIEKKQVMSMFKLLRNDLRQVIDSGSSIGVKVPTSPVMWVAPLRHRFVQLFEEMDIESTWIFANHWGFVPPPLHCLTLSRVAEEALNNIIKHSHASDVEVSLIEDDRRQNIILEIKDNGQGFTVETVAEGLHVGLQSMQVRVKRIGGDFHISSEAGLTVIRAIIPIKR